MTHEQILLVKRTWNIFREIDPVLVGDVFYSKLFVDDPHLESLFHIPRNQQSKKLIDMLNYIVARLDHMDHFATELSQLAIRHVKYGVKASQYKNVGVALLWTLKQGLGQDWTPDVERAWGACYQFLADTMIQAAYGKRS